MFTANIPGADCDMARMSMKSSSPIHFLFSTTSFSIIGIMAYPPPNVKAPILAKQVKISAYIFFIRRKSSNFTISDNFFN